MKKINCRDSLVLLLVFFFSLGILGDVYADYTQAQIAAMNYSQFSSLPAADIQYLSTAQIASIPSTGWMNTLSAAQKEAMTPAQVQAVNTANISIGSLPADQRSQLTTTQISSISSYGDFQYVPSNDMTSLTPAQIATIPSTGWMNTMSSTQLEALTPAQVQAVNTAVVSIGSLPVDQRAQLSPTQISSISSYGDFQYVPSNDMTSLTPTQIATIPSTGWMNTMNSTQLEALTPAQVQAVNTAVVSIGSLPADQRTQLTSAQISSISSYGDFQYVPADKVTSLTPAQVATIPSTGWMNTMNTTQLEALTPAQVQAVNTANVSIGSLPADQRNQLTAAQIAKISSYGDFQYVPVSMVISLTPAQVATIPSTGWMNTMTSEQKEGMTIAQVQAINTFNVSIGALPADQRSHLVPSQITGISSYGDFQYVPTNMISILTPAQISTIPSTGWMNTMTADQKAQLTSQQVQAINTANVSIGAIPANLREDLTAAQVAKISSYGDFQYIPVDKIKYLTAAQLNSIPSQGWANTFTAAQIQALTYAQIQGLTQQTYNYFKSNITPAQLTPPVIVNSSQSRKITGYFYDPASGAVIPKYDGLSPADSSTYGQENGKK
jgi:hypothetical protein